MLYLNMHHEAKHSAGQALMSYFFCGRSSIHDTVRSYRRYYAAANHRMIYTITLAPLDSSRCSCLGLVHLSLYQAIAIEHHQQPCLIAPPIPIRLQSGHTHLSRRLSISCMLIPTNCHVVSRDQYLQFLHCCVWCMNPSPQLKID